MSDDTTCLPSSTVLVPVDVSSTEQNTLAYAAELCEGGKGELLLVHAVHEPADRPGMYRQLEPSDQLLPMEFIAEKLCRRLLAEAQQQFPQFPCLSGARLRIVVGQPAQRIAEVAEQVGASIIVMSSHRPKGLTRQLLGSIPEGVIKRTRIPVLRLERADSRADSARRSHVASGAAGPVKSNEGPMDQTGMAHLSGAA